MSADSEPESKRVPGIASWINRNWNPLNTVISLAAIVITIVIYIGSQKSRQLVYAVSPSRTVLRYDENLRCKWRASDLEIADDVTIMQVAFWNDGELAITKTGGHVLNPVEMTLGNEVLDATILKESRHYVDARVDRTSVDRIRLDFGALDSRDGLVVQIAYLGSADAAISVAGKIEGQSAIPERRALGDKTIVRLLPLAAILLTIVLAHLATVLEKRGLRVPDKLLTALVLAMIGGTVIFLTIAPRAIEPPFGW